MSIGGTFIILSGNVIIALSIGFVSFAYLGGIALGRGDICAEPYAAE
ncbi:MAG: hypothetical protein IPL33_21305 [Sphingobacteriales bacterium]|nr:hypothetical protein [Sphingobacteriales bacterium]